MEKSYNEWRAVRVVTPLFDAHEALLTESTLSLTLEPHTGLPLISVKKGASVKSIQESRWFKLQLLLGILTVVGLILGVYFFFRLSHQWEIQAHEAWLRDFYRTHAPEKLLKEKNGGEEMISATIKKYEKQMFVLWRKLEKAYGVKVKPPDSIKEL